MLRPKQLVPFFKATQRSWLAAGPTCGTRPGDGSCHPNGLSNPDEQEGENVRRPTPSTPSLLQVQGVSDDFNCVFPAVFMSPCIFLPASLASWIASVLLILFCT